MNSLNTNLCSVLGLWKQDFNPLFSARLQKMLGIPDPTPDPNLWEFNITIQSSGSFVKHVQVDSFEELEREFPDNWRFFDDQDKQVYKLPPTPLNDGDAWELFVVPLKSWVLDPKVHLPPVDGVTNITTNDNYCVMSCGNNAPLIYIMDLTKKLDRHNLTVINLDEHWERIGSPIIISKLTLTDKYLFVGDEDQIVMVLDVGTWKVHPTPLKILGTLVDMKTSTTSLVVITKVDFTDYVYTLCVWDVNSLDKKYTIQKNFFSLQFFIHVWDNRIIFLDSCGNYNVWNEANGDYLDGNTTNQNLYQQQAWPRDNNIKSVCWMDPSDAHPEGCLLVGYEDASRFDIRHPTTFQILGRSEDSPPSIFAKEIAVKHNVQMVCAGQLILSLSIPMDDELGLLFIRIWDTTSWNFIKEVLVNCPRKVALYQQPCLKLSPNGKTIMVSDGNNNCAILTP
jgi:hypothetical protein